MSAAPWDEDSRTGGETSTRLARATPEFWLCLTGFGGRSILYWPARKLQIGRDYLWRLKMRLEKILGVVSVMMLLCARNRFTPANHNALEVTGLYWHFVDIVWVFLYPLFYLIR